jgi:hypothetical protein
MTEPREDPDATPGPDDPDLGPDNDPVTTEPNPDGGDEGDRKEDD